MLFLHVHTCTLCYFYMYMQPDIAPLPNIAAVKVEDPKEGNFLLLISLSLSLSHTHTHTLSLSPSLLGENASTNMLEWLAKYPIFIMQSLSGSRICLRTKLHVPLTSCSKFRTEMLYVDVHNNKM